MRLASMVSHRPLSSAGAELKVESLSNVGSLPAAADADDVDPAVALAWGLVSVVQIMPPTAEDAHAAAIIVAPTSAPK